VYLWANRAQFAEVSLQSVTENDVGDVQLPSMQGTAEDEDALSALTAQDTPENPFSTPSQLDGDLITLTLLPRSRWQTLLNLEVIQERNKPKEPPKAPEKAPFFLPTLPGVEPRFVVTAKATEGHKNDTRRLQQAAAGTQSVFVEKLTACDVLGDYEDFFSFAKTLSPAAIDLELRSLVTLESLKTFVDALTQRLASRRDFEAVQTLQNVFLRMHAEVFIQNPELQDSLNALMQIQCKESERVLGLIASSLGTLGFVRETL